MNCKNCKYFKMTIDNHYHSQGYGDCSHPKMVDDIYREPKKDMTMPKDGIYATCDEGRGELIVGENFGCIHFELKQS